MTNGAGSNSRFVVIVLDPILRRDGPGSRCCGHCYVRHETNVVFHVTEDLVGDVVKAIQQQLDIDVAIKLTTLHGACLPPELPVSALWEFTSTIL